MSCISGTQMALIFAFNQGLLKLEKRLNKELDLAFPLEEFI